MSDTQECRTLQVFVLGGAMFAKDVNTLRRLKAEARRYRSVVVLLDPDPAGRQGRAALDTALSHCRHGFVPGLAASAGADTRYAVKAITGSIKHMLSLVLPTSITQKQTHIQDTDVEAVLVLGG